MYKTYYQHHQNILYIIYMPLSSDR